MSESGSVVVLVIRRIETNVWYHQGLLWELAPSHRRCLTQIYTKITATSSTYDHTYQKIRDPVRSPIVKLVRGGLVVGSVTTSESPLLYVFARCNKASLFALSAEVLAVCQSMDREILSRGRISARWP